ncbi:MAG: phosphoribosyltransferase family protein [Eubacteriales bacterium]
MAKVAKAIWSGFLDIFYPQKCILCGKLLDKQEEDLCNACRLQLPLHDGNCPSGMFVSQVFPLFFYEDKVRDSLLRYKFNGARYYYRYYGTLLSTHIGAKSTEDYDGVTWMPVSRRRKWKRGYDQAYLIAKVVAKQQNLPLVSTLKKMRNNPAQSSTGSSEARKANVMGVYLVKKGADIAGKRWLLIDDIWTTGATANEGGRMLLTGGAKAVDCGVVAATRER